ncbi:TPA: MFS transporter [Citrobacter braakii]|uniref:MFS transporter n=1 Tax=Citrobacter sp. Cb031 TaxID=2985025 RepID=UPI00257BBAAB|nr:MFS transporter [Citrobacter sp. Cb031]MDM3464666.1 MFS transporter [Citrobacter sp. Cb031]
MEKLSNLVVIYLIPIICGFTAANMYYVQPLTPVISSELMVSYEKASMLYSFSLAGNALSLFFIIPLGDFYSKRKLITFLYSVSTIALLIFFITDRYYVLSATAFLIGIGTSVIPLITAGLSKQKDGTKYIGRIMAGVLTGILFSRFLSSMLSELWGWKSVYAIAALLMFLSGLLLFINYPASENKDKKDKKSYSHILYQNINGISQNAVIRHYCLNAFAIMYLFSAFWSNVSMYLTTAFHLSQLQVGIFSLTGVSGATSALFSSRILKSINYKNNALYFLIVASLLVMGFCGNILIITIIGALLIDAFIQLIHVNNQRGLFLSCMGNEARAASCYMSSFITGGATGGFISSYLYTKYGWSVVLISCAIITLIPMFIKLREKVNGQY